MGPGERLFSFAVIADTHVNQEEDKASSDFAVNRLSNARNRRVIEAVNRARPLFVLHLGDIVHPTPQHPGYADAARAFHDLAAAIESPLHLIPGNHDVGDKPGDWLPVPSVNEAYLALYDRYFGRNFHSFDAEDCHIAMIDAQVINSGLAAEEEQRRWLEEDLASSPGKRIFLCTHYPPYVFDPGEGTNYDNIDEPGRSWLLGLIARHEIEAVFCGHVHNFWYHVLGKTQIYLLPSTAFVRLDYSEMYRVEPGRERGRDDAAKLGFLLVDVHERGHVAHAVRTNGECRAPGEAASTAEELAPVHPLTIIRSPLGIDLRHAWAEVTDIALSGAIDEFTRKTVRNDYPLMALWEMGVRRLRVPVGDLQDARVRGRMRELVRCGSEFTVHTHGVPEDFGELLGAHAELVSAWEVIAPMAGIELLAGEVRRQRAGRPFPVRLSKLRRPEDALHHGEKARHVIEHGFEVAEIAALEKLFAPGGALREAFDGVVFRVPRARAPWSEMAAIARLGERAGTRDEAMVRLAGDNPAIAHEDDLETANRVAATLFAAHAIPKVGAWLDTFADVDRGYFPRGGLVDRRYNPKMAGRVCRNVNSVMESVGLDAGSLSEAAFEGGVALSARAGDNQWMLILPGREIETAAIAGAPRGPARWIDLATGVVTHACPALVHGPVLSCSSTPAR